MSGMPLSDLVHTMTREELERHALESVKQGYALLRLDYVRELPFVDASQNGFGINVKSELIFDRFARRANLSQEDAEMVLPPDVQAAKLWCQVQSQLCHEQKLRFVDPEPSELLLKADPVFYPQIATKIKSEFVLEEQRRELQQKEAVLAARRELLSTVVDKIYVWRRPYQIVPQPCLFGPGNMLLIKQPTEYAFPWTDTPTAYYYFVDTVSGALLAPPSRTSAPYLVKFKDAGVFNDAFFLTAIAMISTDRTMFSNMFASCEHAALGMFSFRFYSTYQDELNSPGWKTIIIDDLVPVTREFRPAFGLLDDPNECWLTYLEKAYAKFLDSYSGLHHGSPATACVHLTGGSCCLREWDGSFIDEKNLATLWWTLRENNRHGILTAADFIDESIGSGESTTASKSDSSPRDSTVAATTTDGLAAAAADHHSEGSDSDSEDSNDEKFRCPPPGPNKEGGYESNGIRRKSVKCTADEPKWNSDAVVVLAVWEVGLKQQQYPKRAHKMVKVRNLFGRNTYCGDWSEDSPLWTKELREKAGYRAEIDEDDYVVWMKLEDFARRYNTLLSCQNFQGAKQAFLKHLPSRPPGAVTLHALQYLITVVSTEPPKRRSKGADEVNISISRTTQSPKKANGGGFNSRMATRPAKINPNFAENLELYELSDGESMPDDADGENVPADVTAAMLERIEQKEQEYEQRLVKQREDEGDFGVARLGRGAERSAHRLNRAHSGGGGKGNSNAKKPSAVDATSDEPEYRLHIEVCQPSQTLTSRLLDHKALDLRRIQMHLFRMKTPSLQPCIYLDSDVGDEETFVKSGDSNAAHYCFPSHNRITLRDETNPDPYTIRKSIALSPGHYVFTVYQANFEEDLHYSLRLEATDSDPSKPMLLSSRITELGSVAEPLASQQQQGNPTHRRSLAMSLHRQSLSNMSRRRSSFRSISLGNGPPQG